MFNSIIYDVCMTLVCRCLIFTVVSVWFLCFEWYFWHWRTCISLTAAGMMNDCAWVVAVGVTASAVLWQRKIHFRPSFTVVSINIPLKHLWSAISFSLPAVDMRLCGSHGGALKLFLLLQTFVIAEQWQRQRTIKPDKQR